MKKIEKAVMGHTNGGNELFPPSGRSYDVLMSYIKFACLTCKACGQGRVMPLAPSMI